MGVKNTGGSEAHSAETRLAAMEVADQYVNAIPCGLVAATVVRNLANFCQRTKSPPTLPTLAAQHVPAHLCANRHSSVRNAQLKLSGYYSTYHLMYYYESALGKRAFKFKKIIN